MPPWMRDLPGNGDCIMPREGVFTKVLHGGVIKEGDNLEILEEA